MAHGVENVKFPSNIYASFKHNFQAPCICASFYEWSLVLFCSFICVAICIRPSLIVWIGPNVLDQLLPLTIVRKNGDVASTGVVRNGTGGWASCNISTNCYFPQPATLSLEHELNNQKAVNNRSHYISHFVVVAAYHVRWINLDIRFRVCVSFIFCCSVGGPIQGRLFHGSLALLNSL